MPDNFDGPPKPIQQKRFVTPEESMLLGFLELETKKNEILSQKKDVDELSGLLNKEALQAKIAELKHDKRSTAVQEVTFAYLDLDKLKTINDALGHKEGDKHIKDFASLFRTFFREHDYIYRINGSTGDEFGVLIESNQVELILEKLQEFSEKYPDYPFSFGIKCGARDQDGNLDLEEIIHQADLQMIEQKNVKKLNGVK